MSSTSLEKDPTGHVGLSIDDHIIHIDPAHADRLQGVLKNHKLELILVGSALVAGAIITGIEMARRHHPRDREIDLDTPPALTPQQEQQFTEMYEKFNPQITGYYVNRGLSLEDARDFSHKVFVRARHSFPDFVPRPDDGTIPDFDPHRAWLYRISRNLAINKHRDDSRHPEIPLTDDEDSSSGYTGLNMEKLLVSDDTGPEDALIHKQEAERIRTALHQLLPEYQLVIWLKTLDLSNREICEVFGFSTENAAKSKYHRAIHALQKKLIKLE